MYEGYDKGGEYYLGKASRHLVGPNEVVLPLNISPAVKEIISLLALGPKSKSELAQKIGISENAVCKRIFRARKAGFVISLMPIGYYRLESNERTCKKCGKKLAKLNKHDCCFNCQE